MTTSTQKRMIKHINQTVYELLKQSHFEYITVQKICDTAEINRSTFYRYFQDKYDLLYSLSNFIAEDLISLSSKEHSVDPFYTFESFIYFISNNKVIFKHLLVSSREEDLFRILTRVSSQKILEDAKHSNHFLAYKIMNSKHPHLIADFYSSGLFEIIRRWVENDYNYSNEEILEALYESLDVDVSINNETRD
ncbi:TetR/AcrR family transcriptional regulator [Staphylococcus warneri]|uniref:TetR/AcrR family transcriptional regulator n=1 Tax=Staphylococcus warneri TaxID=1292 RepID=UPI00326136B2